MPNVVRCVLIFNVNSRKYACLIRGVKLGIPSTNKRIQISIISNIPVSIQLFKRSSIIALISGELPIRKRFPKHEQSRKLWNCVCNLFDHLLHCSLRQSIAYGFGSEEFSSTGLQFYSAEKIIAVELGTTGMDSPMI